MRLFLLILALALIPLKAACDEDEGFEFEELKWTEALGKYEADLKPKHSMVRRCLWTWEELPPIDGRRAWRLREENCHLVNQDEE